MRPARQRIAIVGAGAAGTTAAWLLEPEHDVTLFEAADRVGGHAHTVEVDVDGEATPVELGAEFAFEIGYGGLLALADRLGISRRTDPVHISMTLDDGATVVAVPPRTAYAVWRCLPPRTMRRLYWLRALGVGAEDIITHVDWSPSVADLIARTGMPRDVADDLVIPLVAASWGVEREQAEGLAAYAVARVMGLRLERSPHNVTFAGGLSAYLRALVADAPTLDLRLKSPARGLGVADDGLMLDAGDGPQRFDGIVLACDWRTSAGLCADASAFADWRAAFEAFPDYPARVAVHRDTAFMPADRRLWGKGNFAFPTGRKPRSTVWSGFLTGADVFRTWLRADEEPPPSTRHIGQYRHVLVEPAHPARQARIAALQGQGGIYAAGMYTTGVDCHESAVRSAVRVAERLAPDGERVRWLAERVSD